MRLVSGMIVAAWLSLGFGAAVAAQSATQTIAVEASLTGSGISASGSFYGVPGLQGARLAVAEANQVPGAVPVSLSVWDDHSSPGTAAGVARAIGASDAVAEVGPNLTVIGMATGPIYAQAGLVSIVPTAHGDAVPNAATTFQPIFNTGELGEALANYLFYVLQGQCADVLYRDDAYGHPTAKGFGLAADRLNITANFYPFTDDAGRAKAVQSALADSCHPAIVLGMLSGDAIPIIEALRRAGFAGPILGPDSISGDTFAALFNNTPEERAKPGFFTNNLYAAAPIIFDSADDATLGFARRFRAYFGQDPSWSAVQGYDSAMLAIAAVRYAVQTLGATASLQARRQAVADYLKSLNSPSTALAGVTGPIWFTPGRGREQPVRMGRFQGGLFESAPLQLVPVPQPDPAEQKSGELRDIGGGAYARIQQVAYTGMYLNEVPRLDIATGMFTADFYLWLRYTPAQNIGDQDPADIDFPNLVAGSFDPRQPVAERSLPDGSVYKLWHVHGEFKNDYDLHHYPFDEQRLTVRLFNAKADSSRIVYVLDRQTFPDLSDAAPAPAEQSSGGALAAEAGDSGAASFALQAAPDAFRNLTQWNPVSVQQVRDNLVTLSALGDPVLVGLERQRELSGFELTIDVKRKMLATLSKTLLPLGLMTLIMFSSLYFPHGLVKEKVTVAVTGALSGAVLLASLNTQLGAVGYTMAVEYIFYVYFALSLLCIVSVLTAERYRTAGKAKIAVRTEFFSRALFSFLVVATAVAVLATQDS
jgi:ABC-type branched-subunit amino acid transport system substrate-binding protein